MGRYVELSIISQFKVDDSEKLKDIIENIIKDSGIEDIKEIDDNSSYIETGYKIDNSSVDMTICSEPEGWEEVYVDEGCFGLFIKEANSSIRLDFFEKYKKHLEELSEKIKEKYNIDYTIFIVGTYG